MMTSRRWCRWMLTVWLAANCNLLALTLTIDGVQYEEVRWGTNDGKEVSVIHRSGIIRIPIAKLPVQFQKQLGYDPDKVAANEAAQEQARLLELQKAAAARQERERQLAEWRAYQSDCQHKVLVEGALVPRKRLERWVGLIVTNAYVFERNGVQQTGVLLEQMEPINDTVLQMNPAMQLRPGLWKSARRNVLCCVPIREPEPGELVQVIGIKVDLVEGWPLVVDPHPFTLEQWRSLPGRSTVSATRN